MTEDSREVLRTHIKKFPSSSQKVKVCPMESPMHLEIFDTHPHLKPRLAHVIRNELLTTALDRVNAPCTGGSFIANDEVYYYEIPASDDELLDTCDITHSPDLDLNAHGICKFHITIDMHVTPRDKRDAAHRKTYSFFCNIRTGTTEHMQQTYCPDLSPQRIPTRTMLTVITATVIAAATILSTPKERESLLQHIQNTNSAINNLMEEWMETN